MSNNLNRYGGGHVRMDRHVRIQGRGRQGVANATSLATRNLSAVPRCKPLNGTESLVPQPDKELPRGETPPGQRGSVNVQPGIYLCVSSEPLPHVQGTWEATGNF